MNIDYKIIKIIMMKKLIVSLLLVTVVLNSNSQEIIGSEINTSTSYLLKAKCQNRDATILTIAGGAGLVITLIYQVKEINAAPAVSFGNTNRNLDPYKYSDYTFYYLLSTACVLLGTTLFILSSKNKRMAALSKLSFGIQGMAKPPILTRTVIKYFPAISYKIPL